MRDRLLLLEALIFNLKQRSIADLQPLGWATADAQLEHNARRVNEILQGEPITELDHTSMKQPKEF